MKNLALNEKYEVTLHASDLITQERIEASVRAALSVDDFIDIHSDNFLRYVERLVEHDFYSLIPMFDNYTVTQIRLVLSFAHNMSETLHVYNVKNIENAYVDVVTCYLDFHCQDLSHDITETVMKRYLSAFRSAVVNNMHQFNYYL